MMSNKPKRPSADKTRLSIIKAAQKLFLKKGYSATPMQEIADYANVNQALLYHHFQNKQGLWKAVKIFTLESVTTSEPNVPLDNFPKAIEKLIDQRFELYQNPKVCQLLKWQLVDPQNELLKAGNSYSPDNWKTCLLHYQNAGELSKDISIDFAVLLIASSISGAFMTDSNLLQNVESKSRYKKLVLATAKKVLGL